MSSGFNVNEFPLIAIKGDNAVASWKSWLTEFKLCIELVTLRLGQATGGADRFTPRMKMLAFLHAIGDSGRESLLAVGFDISDREKTYEEAMDQLKAIYSIEESIYVRTMRFVTISQACGENETDYLL